MSLEGETIPATPAPTNRRPCTLLIPLAVLSGGVQVLRALGYCPPDPLVE